jgi:hypothetical protein
VVPATWKLPVAGIEAGRVGSGNGGNFLTPLRFIEESAGKIGMNCLDRC